VLYPKLPSARVSNWCAEGDTPTFPQEALNFPNERRLESKLFVKIQAKSVAG
jgi:hypothetical protein